MSWEGERCFKGEERWTAVVVVVLLVWSKEETEEEEGWTRREMRPDRQDWVRREVEVGGGGMRERARREKQVPRVGWPGGGRGGGGDVSLSFLSLLS